MKYRPEVDGLRAVAVVPVILFHAGFKTFSGGFVGVDVFFVISGYLISTIILNEMDARRFSLVNFYERRARRILPALFVVMAACVPFAWAWLQPADMASFARSMVAVTIFASNILFWQESGYFTEGTDLQPLLHTWSLAVEEQYYILFPLFLMLFWRFGRRLLLVLLTLGFLGSLAIAHWAAIEKPTAAFYLLPFRAWELVIGVFAAFALQRGPVPMAFALKQVLSFAGLALIGYAIFFFDSETLFPGLPALVPTVGAALIILCAERGTLAYWILSLPFMVGIGLVSYSAYLWHQPIFAFARYHTLLAVDLRVMFALSLLSVALAYVTWRFVETPARNKALFGRRTVFTASAICGVIAISAGALINRGDGLPERYYADTFNLDFASYQLDNGALQDESWAPLRELSGARFYHVTDNEFDRTLWFDPEDPRRNLLVVGNSHSKDLYNILSTSPYAEDDIEVARYGTQVRDMGKRFFTSPNYEAADMVMIVSRYYYNDLDVLPRVVERMLADGKRVALVRSVFEFEVYRGATFNLADLVIQKSYADGERDTAAIAAKSNAAHYREFANEPRTNRGIASDRTIAKIKQAFPEVIVLDRMDYNCSAADQTCFSMDRDLNKFMFDYGHNTKTGVAFFAKRIHEIGWLDELLKEDRAGARN